MNFKNYIAYLLDNEYNHIYGYSGKGWYFYNSYELIGPFKTKTIADDAMSVYYGFI